MSTKKAKSCEVTITCHDEPIAVFTDEKTRIEMHRGETLTISAEKIRIEPALALWR